jgi:hypothetical protein
VAGARPALPEEQPIAARLAGAASVRQELQALLAAAPRCASRAEYKGLVIEENVAGKGSAVTRAKVWQRLRDRYLLDSRLPEFRAFADGMAATADAREQGLLCLLMMARSDRLFREVTLACVSPALQRDGTAIDPRAVHEEVEGRVRAAGGIWSAETLGHVQRHLLAALKDFGVLAGSAAKRTLRPRPGVAATLFAARLARLEGLSDRRVPSSDWFRLLGRDEEGATALLYEAARHGALGFRVQAGIVELSLPNGECQVARA